MSTRSRVVLSVAIGLALAAASALFVIGHKEGDSPTKRVEGTGKPSSLFSLQGTWQCRHVRKAAPGYFDRTYFFGSDSIFATFGMDGDYTILAVGAYAHEGDRLRWIEGVHSAISPQGAVAMDWTVAKPGGPVLRSNFRDRHAQVLPTGPDRMTIRPVSISTGPGTSETRPDPPDDVPCVRTTDLAVERIWRDAPRGLVQQMLQLYSSSPIRVPDSRQPPAGPGSTVEIGRLSEGPMQQSGKSAQQPVSNSSQCVEDRIEAFRRQLLARGTPADEIMIRQDVLNEFEAACLPGK